MANSNISNFIAKQDWLEPVKKALQKAVNKTFQSGGERGRAVEDALHGVWLGTPLHAALTDVPLGAWTAAVAMDVVESATGNSALGKAADTAIAVGLLGAVGAAITG